MVNGDLAIKLIVKHLKNHRDVLTARAKEREKLDKLRSESSGHIYCKNCGLVVVEANDSGLCKSWAENCINDGPIALNLSDGEKQKVTNRIRLANKTRLRILSDIPKSLCSLWADCVSAILYEFAEAKSELVSFAALEKWVKLNLNRV